MTIKDLQARQGNVNIIGEVMEKGEEKEFQKFGKAGRVANAKIKDETGEIKLTLWNDDIDKVKVGDKVEITNGYVNEWQGEMQLTTGKFGTMKILEEGSAEAKTTTEEETEKEATEEEVKQVPEEDEKTEEEVVEEEVVDEEKKE